MLEPFFVKVNHIVYEIVPEEDHTFTVFKWGEEYIQIFRNKNKKWMRLDYKTDQPVIEVNDEVEDLGMAIEGKSTSQ